MTGSALTDEMRRELERELEQVAAWVAQVEMLRLDEWDAFLIPDISTAESRE